MGNCFLSVDFVTFLKVRHKTNGSHLLIYAKWKILVDDGKGVPALGDVCLGFLLADGSDDLTGDFFDSLWHLFNGFQVLMQVFSQTKQRITLRNGLCTYLTSKVVQATEEIGMNLLQGFHLTHIFVCNKVAFPKGVGLLATLTVDGVVAIGKPVKEIHSALIISIFRQQSYALCI